MKKKIKFFLKNSFIYLLSILSKQKIKKLILNKQIFLEIGAGDKKGSEGWTTLDLSKGSDLCWDLRKGIPFPDDSIEAIYTSHTFEHIPFNSLKKLIKDCHRSLKIGGYLSVCVPSVKFYIDSYILGKRFRSEGESYKPALCETGSLIDQLNYTVYMDGLHKYLFDEENLVKILQICGFKEVSIRNFDPQRDLQERDFESIYAIAIK